MKQRVLAIVMTLVILCNSGALAEFRLPAGLKAIEDEAFMGDTSLDEVVLPEGLISIGSKAFKDSSVKRMYLPASLTEIAEDAFDGVDALVGWGPDGTAASSFFDSRSNLTFEREEVTGYIRSIIPTSSTGFTVSFFVPEEMASQVSYLQFTVKDAENKTVEENFMMIDDINESYNTEYEGILPGNYTAYVELLSSDYKTVDSSEKSFTLINHETTLPETPVVQFSVKTYSSSKIASFDWKTWASEKERNVTSYVIRVVEKNADGTTYYESRHGVSGTRLSYGLGSSSYNNRKVFFYVIAMNGMGESEPAGPFIMNNWVVEEDIISFEMPASAPAGSEVRFAVSAPGAEKVMLVINDSDTDVEAPVDEQGKAELTYRMAVLSETEVLQKIAFRALIHGQWSEACSSKTLQLQITSVLEPPVLSGEETISSTEPYTLSWESVEGAEGYELKVMRPNGTFLEDSALTSFGPDILEYTVSAGSLHGSGAYELILTAWAAGSLDVQASKTIAVNDPEDNWEMAEFMFSEQSDGTCVISGYTGKGTHLILPEIDFSGKPVTGIGENAFKNQTSLISVQIPESFRTIGSSAFYGCSALTSITLPSAITEIPDSAFYENTSLQSVTLEGSVKSIGDWSFAFCRSLNRLNLPSGLQSVGNYAFSGCKSLKGLELPSTLVSIGSGAFSNMDHPQLVIPRGVTSVGMDAFNLNETVFIPSGVSGFQGAFISSTAYATDDMVSNVLYTEQGSEAAAFARANGISCLEFAISGKEATLTGAYWANYQGYEQCPVPSHIGEYTVTAIGDHALEGTSFSSVRIPNTVRRIGAYAFASTEIQYLSLQEPFHFDEIDANALTGSGVDPASTALFSESKVLIEGDWAYEKTGDTTDFANIVRYLGSEETIVFPDTLGELPVKHIDENVFTGNTTVRSVTVPSFIHDFRGFSGCYSLEEVTMEPGVLVVLKAAFADCIHLRTVRLPQTLQRLGGISGSDGWGYGGTIIGAFENCVSLSHIYLPAGLQSIAERTFASCDALTTIVLPDSLIAIEGNAFYNCSHLSRVYIPESVTKFGTNCFYGCSKDLVICCAENSPAWTWANQNGFATENWTGDEGEEDDPNRPQLVSFTMPDSNVQHATGEMLSFKVETSNADRVTLMVDGHEYDAVEISGTTAEIQRAFNQGGLRSIAFKLSNRAGLSTVVQAGTLYIFAGDVLDQPEIVLSGSYNTGADLRVSWKEVEHATEYVVYTYYNGSSIERAKTQDLSYHLNAALLTEPGAYGVEVIATAPGYSQRSASLLFTLESFDEYDAFLCDPAAVLYADPECTEFLTALEADSTLHVLYASEETALVQRSDGQRGWIPADKLSARQYVAETQLKCNYSRSNRYDASLPVNISIQASLDIQKVTIDAQGAKTSDSDGKTMTDNPAMKKYTLTISPVTQTTSYTIHAYDSAGNEIKSTMITVAPPKESSVAKPVLPQFAPFTSGQSAEITWTGCSGATGYELWLTYEQNQVLAPVTIPPEKTSYTISGSILSRAGNYELSIRAIKDHLVSEMATRNLTVEDNREYQYLQAETWTRGRYSISFQDMVEIQLQTATTYKLRVVNRLGKETIIDSVPVDSIELGRNQWVPNVQPSFDKTKPVSVISGVNGLTIQARTNLIASSAELLKDGASAGPMTLYSESGTVATWTASVALPGEGAHTFTVRISGLNGMTESSEASYTGEHRHSLKSAQYNANEITPRGVLVYSGTCSTCGETFTNAYVHPAAVNPDAFEWGPSLIISGNLNQPNLVIHNGKIPVVISGTAHVQSIQTEGNVTVMESGSLEASSVSCNLLDVRGNVHVRSIQAQTLGVVGKLTMGAGDTASVRTFDFRSQTNHQTLLTGGEMTISGDMFVYSPFTPGTDHKTIFTSNYHKLNNSARTRFGILVCNGGIGTLGAKNGFTYGYLVLPSSMTMPKPVAPSVPSSVTPYMNSNGKMTKRSLYESLLDKEYQSRFGANFNLSLQTINGRYFTVTKMNGSLPDDSLYIPILQEEALNALSDFCASCGNSILSKILATGAVQHSGGGGYTVKKQHVAYRVSISGIAAGNMSGAMGYLTADYTETRDDKTYHATFHINPNYSFCNQTLLEIMKTMSWEGKEMADQVVEQAQEEIWRDYLNYTVGMTESEVLNKVWDLGNTIYDVAGMTTSQTENLPLLSVYTTSGSMRVYSDNVTGSIPFSDQCNYAFKKELDTILN